MSAMKFSSSPTMSDSSSTLATTAKAASAAASADGDEIIFKPTQYDVLLGRGRPFQSWPGNKRLHTVVDLYKPRYSKAKRHEKTEMAEEIVMFIKTTGRDKVGRCGRFLRRVTVEELRQRSPQHHRWNCDGREGQDGGGSGGRGEEDNKIDGGNHPPHLAPALQESIGIGGGGWVEVSDLIARDKVSHALRGKTPEPVCPPPPRRSGAHHNPSHNDNNVTNSTSACTAGSNSRVVAHGNDGDDDDDANIAKASVKTKKEKMKSKKKKKKDSARHEEEQSASAPYRSHTEAIVQDLLRRKRGDEDKRKQREEQQQNSYVRLKKNKASMDSGSGEGLSTANNMQQTNLLMRDRFNSVSQQQQQQQQQQQHPVGASSNPMNGLQGFEASHSLNREGTSAALTTQIPTSSISISSDGLLGGWSIFNGMEADAVRALRLRNVMLERQLVLTNLSLRGQTGLLSAGLDAAFFPTANTAGTTLRSYLPLESINLLPTSSSAAATSSALAASVRGADNPNAPIPSFGNLASIFPTSQLAASSSFLPTSAHRAEVTMSTPFLSSLRDDQLLSILGRNVNSRNPHHTYPNPHQN
jgi:hypothetical protein